MNFTLPTASRKRLDELLTYLAQPCENYPGNRAEDFKAAVDIESEWAWKYADLMMRGLESRPLPYAERHHMVPFSWYKMNGFEGKRDGNHVCENNMSTLKYDEHLFAHFCLAKCSHGQFKGKMACAFCQMYNVTVSTDKLPEESDVLEYISRTDFMKIMMNMPHVAGVDASGRKHIWEVGLNEYYRQYYEMRKDHYREQSKNWFLANYERAKLQRKRYYEQHKSEILKRAHEHYMDTIEEQREWHRQHYQLNKDKHQAYRLEHRDERLAYMKEYNTVYRAKNRDKLLAQGREHYLANKDEINAKRRELNKAKSAIRKAQKIQYAIDHKEEIEAKKLEKKAIQKAKRVAYLEVYNAQNQDKLKTYRKDYYAERREEIKRHVKEWREEKIAQGYARKRNPVNGKMEWIFVGDNPNRELYPWDFSSHVKNIHCFTRDDKTGLMIEVSKDDPRIVAAFTPIIEQGVTYDDTESLRSAV